jgi:hypothetical protein
VNIAPPPVPAQQQKKLILQFNPKQGAESHALTDVCTSNIQMRSAMVHPAIGE